MKYLRGICHICGKGIYLNEPYKTDSNLVCEIIVCSECHKKAIKLFEDYMEEIEHNGGHIKEAVKNKLSEAEQHMKPYMNDMNQTKLLREMCKHCEEYCGKQHDYSECRDKWCYKFWLAYEYLELASSYE